MLNTRRLVTLTAVMVIVVAPLQFILWAGTPSANISTRATSWVDGMTEANRLVSARNISSLPKAYRKALLRSLSTSAVTDVWTNHLSAYLTAHPNVSSEQRRYLEQVIRMMRDGTLVSAKHNGQQALLDSLSAESKVLFPDDAQFLFADLGPSDKLSREPLMNRMAGWLASRVTVHAQYTMCGCSTESDYCSDDPGVGAQCLESGVIEQCNETGGPTWPSFCCTDCGWLGMYNCDGMCWLSRLE